MPALSSSSNIYRQSVEVLNSCPAAFATQQYLLGCFKIKTNILMTPVTDSQRQ